MKLQAKHIKESEVLLAVNKHQKNIGASFWDIELELPFPRKVVRAKLIAMYKKNILSGCTIMHNCRGDFTINPEINHE